MCGVPVGLIPVSEVFTPATLPCPLRFGNVRRSMTSPRPFRVLGVQQIAIGGRDKSALRHLWVDLLGLHPESTFRSERENVDEDILALGEGPRRVEVDLMQPIDPDKKPRV